MPVHNGSFGDSLLDHRENKSTAAHSNIRGICAAIQA
jgi:hypothetical protein